MHNAKDFKCIFESDLKFEVNFENKIEIRKKGRKTKKNKLFQARFLSPRHSFKPKHTGDAR
jgi:hypothetical protein